MEPVAPRNTAHSTRPDQRRPSGAEFLRIDFSQVTLHRANLRTADLSWARLDDSNLLNANLSGAELQGASLVRTRLDEATLGGADLADANLTDANLTGTNLLDANLTDANFHGTILWETIFSNTNLSKTEGLEQCLHHGPSTIDHRTLALSGAIPDDFLRGCGLNDWQIEAAHLHRPNLSPEQIAHIVERICALYQG
jgi:uncharacterized protein YjbI with pentapeptide repeats